MVAIQATVHIILAGGGKAWQIRQIAKFPCNKAMHPAQQPQKARREQAGLSSLPPLPAPSSLSMPSGSRYFSGLLPAYTYADSLPDGRTGDAGRRSRSVVRATLLPVAKAHPAKRFIDSLGASSLKKR